MTAAASRPLTRRRPASERVIETLLLLAAVVGIFTTVGIIVVLAVQAADFFAIVNPIDFLAGTQWSANIQPYQFGVLALVASTLLVAVIALLVAIPLGLWFAWRRRTVCATRTSD